MISQLEFEEILAQLSRPDGPEGVRLPRAKPGLNTQTFAIGLARALRVENLAHAAFNVLTVIAREQAGRGQTTIPRVAAALGISFNAVQMHLHKSPHFFEITKSAKQLPGVNLLKLTPEAIALLVKIQKKANHYAKQIA